MLKSIFTDFQTFLLCFVKNEREKNLKLNQISIDFQTSINELDKDDDVKYALFPGFQQRDRQPLPAILPPHDDIFQDADESQPLTSESQQNTPQHMANQMMVTPAVSGAFNNNSYISSLFIKFHYNFTPEIFR